MFQFGGLASPSRGWRTFSAPGCPIRTSGDLRSFAASPGFSQLVASFLASGSLGIHRAPSDTSRIRTTSLPHYVFHWQCLSVFSLLYALLSCCSCDCSASAVRRAPNARGIACLRGNAALFYFSCLLPACQRSSGRSTGGRTAAATAHAAYLWRIRDSNP